MHDVRRAAIHHRRRLRHCTRRTGRRRYRPSTLSRRWEPGQCRRCTATAPSLSLLSLAESFNCSSRCRQPDSLRPEPGARPRPGLDRGAVGRMVPSGSQRHRRAPWRCGGRQRWLLVIRVPGYLARRTRSPDAVQVVASAANCGSGDHGSWMNLIPLASCPSAVLKIEAMLTPLPPQKK